MKKLKGKKPPDLEFLNAEKDGKMSQSGDGGRWINLDRLTMEEKLLAINQPASVIEKDRIDDHHRDIDNDQPGRDREHLHLSDVGSRRLAVIIAVVNAHTGLNWSVRRPRQADNRDICHSGFSLQQ